jgi:hypothetical protein
VSSERKRRGIAAFRRKGKDVEWTEAMIARLGADIDRVIAAELGLTASSVTTRNLLRIQRSGDQAPRRRIVLRLPDDAGIR